MENSERDDLKEILAELLLEKARSLSTEDKRKIIKMFLDRKLHEILMFCDIVGVENLQGKIKNQKNQKAYHFSFMKEETLN